MIAPRSLRSPAIGALLTLPSCAASPAAPAREEPAGAGIAAIAAPRTDDVAPREDRACAGDADCGYDPAMDRCIADPRANRQPPVRDQGIVCYCMEARAAEAPRACATLRVPPVPCESDASCAVRRDPRPHPVAASLAIPHEKGKPCRDFTIATTCERTNICTMHPLPCGDR